MPVHYAHSGRMPDRSDWQRLPDHLAATARLAAARGEALGLAQAAGLAGALHDLGKIDPAFDARLLGEKVRVDHSTAGGAVLLAGAAPALRPAAEALAYAILGHHAGLPDRRGATEACLDRRCERFEDRLDPVWQHEVAIDLGPVLAELAGRIRPGPGAAFDLSVAVRMVFSCLVDADFRETEAFYAALEGWQPDRDWPALPQILPDLTRAFDARMAGFDASGGVNRLRAEVLAHVRDGATLSPGLFTLTVPTGGGKTLASMGFALDHARAHGHRRIIYAIPYTSIIDQTVAVFRGLFGDGAVLAHHSAMADGARLQDGAGHDASPEGRDKIRLAMEDWAAPIVVTTNVQLFESLFAARTSRARKLHNIAGSIIILDEVQTLPRNLLRPALRMLDTLAACYGCTIVLCTATQPAFDSRQLPQGLALAGRELAPDPVALSAELRRARIGRVGAMDNAALLQELAAAVQGLVIVNSRAHALELFREGQAAGITGLIHLTTRQYPAHRQEILADLRARLDPVAPQPCRVIATSLVEAGVDLDFPRVWRAEAGLDQIVQAAGRCNREGRRPLEESLVTVFAAPDYPAPAAVQVLADAMRTVAGRHEDLLSQAAMRDYFEELYWTAGPDRLGADLLNLISVTGSGTDFAFRKLAEKFRMIDSLMVPVVIPREEAAQREIARLGVEAVRSGTLARALQPFTVQVPERARARMVACGKASFRHPELRGDQFCVLDEMSLYHADSGLWWEDAEYLAMDHAII